MPLLHSRFVRFVLPFLLGLALCAGLFALDGFNLALFSQIELHGGPLAGLLALSFALPLLAALKWRAISLAWFGTAPSLKTHLKATSEAVFWAQILPPTIVMPLQRALLFKYGAVRSASSGFWHAFYDLGFDFLVILALLPVVYFQIHLKLEETDTLLLATLHLVGVGIFLCFSTRLVRFLTAFLPKEKDEEQIKDTYKTKRYTKLLRFASLLKQMTSSPLFSPSFMFLMLFLGVLRFFVTGLRLYLGALALGLPLSGFVIFLASVPAALPSLIPLTPASLGIAEWSWASCLSLWGHPLALGALFALGFRLLSFVSQAFWAAVSLSLFTRFSLFKDAKK